MLMFFFKGTLVVLGLQGFGFLFPILRRVSNGWRAPGGALEGSFRV